ncbi:sensor histidine kinase [Actinosynnema mirum]|uniref:histidine kinase n=1 Tax=Actinosynnema mirum (strain ATCC 29888 / DSM 43827 / JCM 3225 / NBRC 14064 / NCIMB 13271 / NRRL B-12336 / IMRU 3971 / 101) TaxID=446462 RepID=C6WA48_ACTMD|nr:nitrate- and nitrite sensing domain-containing protein [Actinosynnema mirum]ACU39237.1 putative sensor with HAMP domain [Actinosynnema mirum DSM 43827]
MRGHDDHASGEGRPERTQLDAGAQGKAPDPGPGTTTTPTAGRGISRWRLRNWKLRSKLVVVLLVPAMSTLALAGLRLTTQLDDVELYGKVQRELQLSAQAAAVGDALQLERDAAVGYVAAGRKTNPDATARVGELNTRSGKVDAEVMRLRDVGAATGDIDDTVRTAYEKSLQSLDGLNSLRNTVLESQYPDASVASAYGQLLGTLLQVHRATSSSLSNEHLTPLVGANLALYAAKEQLAQQNSILISAANRSEFGPNQANALRGAQSKLDSAITDFTNVASQDNRQNYQDTVSGTAVDARNRLVTLALVQNDNGKAISFNENDALRVGEDTAALLRQVSLDIEDQAQREAVRLTDEANALAWRDGALVAAALIIAFALMAVVATSMLTPLRVLRRTALDVARNRLPDAIKRIRTHRDPERAAEESLVPVPIHTTEEVGQVARAFDAVQREAIRLAVEQVALRANVNDMFINLSRRSQALVERQITVIDRLEQDEQDPDQLASLFELDHLATQMRRNSENLLVLSGTTVTRRVTRPVPITEVLGAAVSEVEKYARVHIAPAPDLRVQGRVVNDLAHLIAELLDNATAFSKPSTKVTVRAIETRRGEVSIRIHDRGVGMQEQDVVEANLKLSEPPEVDVSVAREMGLYVVGQLAKRHEIHVSLRNNDDIEGGVTAQVLLPAGLLHRGPDPQGGGGRQSLPLGRPGVLALADPPEVEETGAVALSGLPKWSPDQMPSAFGEAAPEHAFRGRPGQNGVTPQETTFSGSSFSGTSFDSFEDTGAHRPVEHNSSADGLFTATVTETAPPRAGDDIDYSYPPAQQGQQQRAVPAPAPAVVEDDASTQRLPIYEDVLSRWFQGGDEDSGEARVRGEGRTRGEHALPDEPEPQDHDVVLDGGSDAERTVFAEPVGDAQPDQALASAPASASGLGGLPKREPAPSKVSAAAANWGSSDDNWSTASKVLKSAVDESTTAGLPKRVPKARLMPGSLSTGSSTTATQATVRAEGRTGPSGGVATAQGPRSADRLRQRFATYQRGLQMGRDNNQDDDSLPWEGLSFGNSDKEQK